MDGPEIEPGGMSGAFMLDTEMFTWIQGDPEALAAFVSPGRRLQVLITHVQRDQVSAATDEGVSERVAMLDYTTEVETTGAVWDVSRWDEALFGTDADNALIASVTGEDSQPPNRLRSAADGLIAATARAHGAVLVMRDHRSVRRARAEGVRVCSWDDFRALLVDG